MTRCNVTTTVARLNDQLSKRDILVLCIVVCANTTFILMEQLNTTRLPKGLDHEFLDSLYVKLISKHTTVSKQKNSLPTELNSPSNSYRK